MPMTNYKVPPKFKPTPQVVKANPTVKQFTTGQVINMETQPRASGLGVVKPTQTRTLTGVSGSGTAGFRAPQYTVVPNTGGSSVMDNYAYNLRTQAGGGSVVRSTSTGGGGGGSSVIDNYNYQVNPGGYPGSSVIDNYNYNLESGLTQPPTYGGGNGGGNGGGGGGGGGNAQPVIAPVVQPVRDPKGNNVSVALNWRVG